MRGAIAGTAAWLLLMLGGPSPGTAQGMAQATAGAPIVADARGADGAASAASAAEIPAVASAPAALPAPAMAAAGYALGPEDQIEVTIYGQPDMPLRLRIKQDGTVSLPLMGAVTAAGETPVGLAEKIRAGLVQGGYLHNPRVNVEVTGYISRSVTLLGAVVRPGIYPLQGAQPLSRVLATAGGPRDGSETVVLRRAAGPPQRFSIAALAAGERDPVLQPGDLLYVPEAEHFYIYGQVRQPGSYPIRGGMTFRQALSQGGGPNDAGTQRRIRLTRDGKESAIDDLDAPILNGDVMFVRERLF